MARSSVAQRCGPLDPEARMTSRPGLSSARAAQGCLLELRDFPLGGRPDVGQ
jgi:hypothetical protein